MYRKEGAVAIIVAILVAVPIMLAVDTEAVDSDTDSSSTYGEFNFWFYDGSDLSEPITGSGYDAKVAFEDAVETVNSDSDSSNDISFTYATSTDENGVTVNGSQYVYETSNDYGDYLTINTIYGQIAKINEDFVYRVYYYIDSSRTWEVAMDSIGFYRPFSDYDSEFSTANMILCLVDGSPSSFPSGEDLQPIVSNIVGNSDFQVTFHLTIDPACVNNYVGTPTVPISKLSEGITVCGYGSDVYLALCNAIDSVVGYSEVSYTDEYGNEAISTMYGYVEDIYGLEYYVTEDYLHYYYWSTYTGDSTSLDDYCDFMFGYYSPLSSVPDSTYLYGNEFTLVYTYS